EMLLPSQLAGLLSYAPHSRVLTNLRFRGRPAAPAGCPAAAVTCPGRLDAPPRPGHGRSLPPIREPGGARDDDGHGGPPGAEIQVSGGRVAPGLSHRPVRRSGQAAAAPAAAPSDHGELR